MDIKTKVQFPSRKTSVSQSDQSFSPSFDHFENSGFSLESGTAVLLLLETDETLEENTNWLKRGHVSKGGLRTSPLTPGSSLPGRG